jgi:hypothetical protein
MKRRVFIAALAATWLASHAVTLDNQARAQAAGHTLLLIKASSGSYAISGRRDVAAPMPRAKKSPVHQGWSFQALNAAGTVIHVGELPNPHVVRGDFHDGDGETSGVLATSGADVTFAIRVPKGATSVVLYGTPVPVPAGTSAAARTAASSAIVARINL